MLPSKRGPSDPTGSYEGCALHSASVSSRQPFAAQSSPVENSTWTCGGGDSGGGGGRGGDGGGRREKSTAEWSVQLQALPGTYQLVVTVEPPPQPQHCWLALKPPMSCAPQCFARNSRRAVADVVSLTPHERRPWGGT